MSAASPAGRGRARRIGRWPALGALMLGLALLLAWPLPGHGQDWIKDPRRLHVGAHGQLSCLDCHEAVQEGRHPEPARVDARPRREVKPTRCYACHPEVETGLAQGRHGQTVLAAGRKDQARYQRCVSCHDPHYGYARGAAIREKFAPGLPRFRQCGACHPARDAAPMPASGSEACWGCHVAAPGAGGVDPDALAPLCLACHGQAHAAPWPALVLAGGVADLGAHQALDCTVCHQRAARFPHEAQSLAACTSCHPPHDEATAGGDAHQGVTCSACHMVRLIPTRADGLVTAAPPPLRQRPQSVHRLATWDDDQACRRCHHAGNRLGAADMVLPPKGVLCLPCHRATLTLGGWPSRIALALLVLGLALIAGTWLAGRRGGEGMDGGHATSHGLRLGAALKGLLLDGLLQRRLWQHSPLRGLIHSLIFLPFVLRTIYGLAGLVLGLAQPAWPLSQVLMGKNHPVTALFFDLTGALVLAGVLLALARRLLGRARRLPGLPGPDWLGLGLLAGAVLMGFIVEAGRIAMTGFPPGSAWAFLGAALARFFPAGSGGLYGWLWYAHAILWAAFAAYLPFSRMLHILAAPLALALRAGERQPPAP